MSDHRRSGGHDWDEVNRHRHPLRGSPLTAFNPTGGSDDGFGESGNRDLLSHHAPTRSGSCSGVSTGSGSGVFSAGIGDSTGSTTGGYRALSVAPPPGVQQGFPILVWALAIGLSGSQRALAVVLGVTEDEGRPGSIPRTRSMA